MKLRVALVVLSCALSILTGLLLARRGPDGKSASGKGRPRIGLSMDTLKEERWVGDRDMFVRRANELGADVSVQSANSDDSRQIRDVEGLITQGIDVLVIIPHDGAACAKAVEIAHHAGIPVLAYDRLITGCDLDLYLTFDNVKVGELQARFLTDRLGGGGPKKKLVRIYGSKTDNNALLFKQGQDQGLAPFLESGALEVVHEDWAQDWRPENAKRIANAALTKGSFDAILASNDGTAGGAIQALTEEGLAGKVLVTGQDADAAACQRIVAGTQSMTIYKPLSGLANRAAELAVKLARRQPIVARAEIHNGKIAVPSVLLDVIPVTRENLDDTVIKDGFHSRAAVYKGVEASVAP
ncbi:MAG TPA: substrate-binding domain-containing protein [Chthoniobacteraceae bacterium]|jgi:D-xylose transport system substrate-binding protein|nr:xylF [Chthoniobacter sp.]HEV7866432.1 substrate-binding domain-containing protein [Chthoniobacteraceae bacterium]